MRAKRHLKRGHLTAAGHQTPAMNIAALPMFCDYMCVHASFPPPDAVGACRKEVAVYCTLLKKYNNKNAR
ncbi:MAG: hypothetical protein AAB393_08780, partial [Bacteroidota bacterium]